jgi:hypothetical protein
MEEGLFMGGSNEIIKEIAADSTPIPECSNICAFSCGCDCDCCKSGQTLCIANSKCASNITVFQSQPSPAPQPPSSSVSVSIPANSCVTKIYSSMPNAPTAAKYILIEVKELVMDTTIFCHALPNLASMGPVFDTTLVQPLCVGSTGATATVTALNENNVVINEFLTLTVVYCPGCC